MKEECTQSMMIENDDEFIVSWITKDWNHIHRIQDWFGQRRYTTVNKISKFIISRDDPKYPVFLEGEQKGLYTIHGKRQ